MKRLRVVIVASLLSWGAGAGYATPPQFQIIIESASPYYLPAKANVPLGAPIRWDNPTGSPHTITHDGCVTAGPCAFDSGSLPPGGSYSVPGLPPGQYPYQCRLHPIMRGIVTVTEPPTTQT